MQHVRFTRVEEKSCQEPKTTLGAGRNTGQWEQFEERPLTRGGSGTIIIDIHVLATECHMVTWFGNTYSKFSATPPTPPPAHTHRAKARPCHVPRVAHRHCQPHAHNTPRPGELTSDATVRWHPAARVEHWRLPAMQRARRVVHAVCWDGLDAAAAEWASVEYRPTGCVATA